MEGMAVISHKKMSQQGIGSCTLLIARGYAIVTQPYNNVIAQASVTAYGIHYQCFFPVCNGVRNGF